MVLFPIIYRSHFPCSIAGHFYGARRKLYSAFWHFSGPKVVINYYSRSNQSNHKKKDVKVYLDADKYEVLNDILDFRKPHMWYPQSRKMKRKFYIHIGPTNSGKTHEAMNHLIKSSSGIYCAPLRLLAEQGFESLNMAGLLCDLITGEKVIRVAHLSPEKRKMLIGGGMRAKETIMDLYLKSFKNQPFEDQIQSNHISATIEMVDVTRSYECAVVDEYQLIGDPERGWAWTRVILGICANVIHLCGDPSALELIKQIIQIVGDEFEIKEYRRLSPLLPYSKPLKPKNWANQIRPGDAIIAFSRQSLYYLKDYIESKLGPRTCMIYGALPSNIRSSQVKIFNDSIENRNILIASDAIGLGLNLNIGRIIFYADVKFDGKSSRRLIPNEVKQIAGRAGRYMSKYPSGYYCGIGNEIHDYTVSAMEKDVIQVLQATLGIQIEQIEALNKIVNSNSLYELIKIFEEFATISGKYFLQDGQSLKTIAKWIDRIPLSIKQKFLFCSAPINVDDVNSLKMLKTFAKIYSRNKKVKLPKLKAIKSLWSTQNNLGLETLELIYRFLDAYIWLSYRIKEFIDAERALKYKIIIEKKIQKKITQNVTRMNGKRRLRHLKWKKSSFKRVTQKS